MSKYPYKLKIKVVKKYFNGRSGYTFFSNKYNISSSSVVENWTNQYKFYGEEGLKFK